jgi:hypothetical protein
VSLSLCAPTVPHHFYQKQCHKPFYARAKRQLISIVSYYYYLFAKRYVPNLVQFQLREYGFGESSDDSDQPNDGDDGQRLGPSKFRPEWIQYGAVSVDGEGDERVRGDEDGGHLCRTHDGAYEATDGPVLAQYRNVRKRSVEECR